MARSESIIRTSERYCRTDVFPTSKAPKSGGGKLAFLARVLHESWLRRRHTKSKRSGPFEIERNATNQHIQNRGDPNFPTHAFSRLRSIISRLIEFPNIYWVAVSSTFIAFKFYEGRKMYKVCAFIQYYVFVGVEDCYCANSFPFAGWRA